MKSRSYLSIILAMAITLIVCGEIQAQYSPGGTVIFRSVWPDSAGFSDLMYYQDQEGDTLVVFQDSTDGQPMIQAGQGQSLGIIVDSAIISKALIFPGSSSGSFRMLAAAIAGNPLPLVVPTTDGSPGWQWTTDGFGNTSWAPAAGVGSGEANTASTSGPTFSIVEPKAGVDLLFKSFTGGDAISLDSGSAANELRFDFDGGATPSGDLGGTWSAPTVVGGTSDSTAKMDTTYNAFQAYVANHAGAGGGETNTSSSSGSTFRIQEDKAGVDLPFKTITPGDAISGDSGSVAGELRLDFDGGATPSGDLGGTWANPSVDDNSHNHIIANVTAFTVVEFEGQLSDANSVFTNLATGEVTISGGVSAISPDVIGPDEMADADHGDVSWSGGVATVEGGVSDSTGKLDTTYPPFQEYVANHAGTGFNFFSEDDVGDSSELAPVGPNTVIALDAPVSLKGNPLTGVSSVTTEGGASGFIDFGGGTSGIAGIGAQDVAGTPSRILLPTTDGSNGDQLTTDGAGNTSWQVAGGGAGEANTSSSSGATFRIQEDKSGVDLPFKTITPGDAISGDSNSVAGELRLDFDGGATPGGDLGGTWANPSVDDNSHNHIIANVTAFTVVEFEGQLSDANSVFTNLATGEVTISGGVSAISPDVIGPDEMADADHGDVSWSGGVATVSDGAIDGDKLVPALKDSISTAFDHVTSDGSDHTFIDQEVTAGSSPTFDAANITGVVTGSVETLHMKVRAGTSTIAKGMPVYTTAYNVSGYWIVEPSDASDSATMSAVAITSVATTTSATVNAVKAGRATGLVTDTITEGAIDSALYVAAGGGLTVTKPTGANLIQKMAIFSRSHSSAGVVQVIGAGRSNDVPNIDSGKIWVGDNDSVATAVHVSGDATMDAAGVFSNAFADSAGQVDFADIDPGTNTQGVMIIGSGSELVPSGSGIINATRFQGVTTVDATEFGYLDGVTSAIQTQLDAVTFEGGFYNPGIMSDSLPEIDIAAKDFPNGCQFDSIQIRTASAGVYTLRFMIASGADPAVIGSLIADVSTGVGETKAWTTTFTDNIAAPGETVWIGIPIDLIDWVKYTIWGHKVP